MIHNEELPIGFTMELAQHSDALIRFSNMSKDEQQIHQIICVRTTFLPKIFQRISFRMKFPGKTVPAVKAGNSYE